MLKMIGVVAAIVKQNGQALLAQHPPHTDQLGMWEFAGGKMEPDEGQSQTLAHELQREIDIITHPAYYVASYQQEVPGHQIHLHVWWVPYLQGVPLVRYHIQLRWCLPTDILTLDLAPADIPLLHAFIVQHLALSGR